MLRRCRGENVSERQPFLIAHDINVIDAER
jgi:hypothetical protein